MAGIISSFSVLSKRFKRVLQNPSDPRVSALQHYFDNGGVVSVTGEDKDGWPEITYPTRARLQLQLKDLQQSRDLFSKKRGDWNRELWNAQWYDAKNHAKKLVDPLYWKHVQKKLLDPDYRADVERVKLPTQMVSDKRYRPMVDMFVNDIEYRKQLTETVENSIVYKKDRRVARYANELQSFRKDVSTNRLKELDQKLKEVDETIHSMKVLLQWAKR